MSLARAHPYIPNSAPRIRQEMLEADGLRAFLRVWGQYRRSSALGLPEQQDLAQAQQDIADLEQSLAQVDAGLNANPQTEGDVSP